MKTGDLVVYTVDDGPGARPRVVDIITCVRGPFKDMGPVAMVIFTNVAGKPHWYFQKELRLANDYS